MLRAPSQKVTLNGSVDETVRDLIGRAAIAVGDTEESFHLVNIKVGHAPGFDFPRRAQLLEAPHDIRELRIWHWPMQQIEIENVGTEARETGLQARAIPSPDTSLASTLETRNTRSRCPEMA